MYRLSQDAEPIAVPSSGTSVSYVQHAKRDGVMYKIGSAAKFELVVNSFAIRLNRTFADPEFLRDVLTRESSRDFAENLSLAPTESFRLWLAGHSIPSGQRRVCNGITHARVEVLFPAMGKANRLVQLRVASRSQNISANANGKQGPYVAGVLA